MAIELRAVSYSPSTTFAFNDLDEEVDTDSDSSPEIPIADLPSPPTSWLPASDMNMYGARPLFPDTALVTCKDCNKPVQESALAEHAVNCEKIRNDGGESLLGEGGKKRKADELSGDGTLNASASGGGVLGSAPGSGGNGGPAKKKKKTTVKAGKTGKTRVKPPIDVDKQCGVFDEKRNAICTRSITCKVHSMLAKRALPGRSKPYDELLLDWKRANDPKFVEPVPKPPRVPKAKGEGAAGGAGAGKKKEAKERKERERLEKRAADIAAGLIDPNAPFVTPKKKKSKKATGAGGAAGLGVGAGGVGVTEYDSEDGKDLDSDVEVDALISAVHRSRTALLPQHPVNPNSSARNSRPIPSANQAQGQAPAVVSPGGPSALARPQNGTNFFVARNEVLRCCADILVKALQKPVGGTNGASGAGAMGPVSGGGGMSGGGLGAGSASW